jgi:hypothetical protein
MQSQDITKFEFLLTLEKNIVIQRYFNVPNYNPKAKNSLDLHECVKQICREISSDLKEKTLDFMSDEHKSFVDFDDSGLNTRPDEEYFLLRIMLGEEVFISRIFPAHIYHPKARYAVDIRPKVRKILSDLTAVLSSRVLTTNYLQYELKA